jgi:hypothetical protein
MTRTAVLTFAGAVAAACLTLSIAQASPATGALDSLRATGAAQSNVEQAGLRCHYRVWWHHGHRHWQRVCHRHRWHRWN